MERPKRWHLCLIISALILTVYNILPTIFFYTKPLKSPIDQKRAEAVATQIADRVNALESQSIAWIDSFSKLIGVKPLSIQIDAASPQLVQVKFNDLGQANLFRRFLPRAGRLIEFSPAELQLHDQEFTSKTVTVKRRVPIHFKPHELSAYFQYGALKDAQGHPTEFYRALMNDRLIFLGAALGNPSENSSLIQSALNHPEDAAAQDLLVQACQNLLHVSKIFEKNPSIRQRYFASFSHNGSRPFIDAWLSTLDRLKDQGRLERISLTQEKFEEGSSADIIKQQKLEFLIKRETVLSETTTLVRKYMGEFSGGVSPLDFEIMASILKSTPMGPEQTFSLQGRHPLIESLTIDWNQAAVSLNLYSDIQNLRDNLLGLDQQRLDQLIFNEIAALSRQSGEKIKPFLHHFVIKLHDLPEAQSFLAFRLYHVAKAETDILYNTLLDSWAPRHPDLQRNVFPIWDYETYQKLPASEKKLGLIVFSPSTLGQAMPPSGFKINSIYVIAKGVDKILAQYEASPSGTEESAKEFLQDFNNLRTLLQKNGFIGYSGAAYPIASQFKSDFIFEHEDYYQDLLKATRESFSVHGTKRYALLEFSNFEERILTENKIDNQIHEELLKWRDDYRAARVDLKGAKKFDVPAPTKNVLWDNLKLSFVKYFRGDERKIIRWGLDLSGGKTVQLELRDTHNNLVTNESDIRQGMSELYNRVNKMGVAEVTIRQEGNSIALDFPGSQSLSAAELVKASSMFFHLVNEKFMLSPTLADATHRFLQDVWNEAVVTGKKESEEINTIACRHLYGESSGLEEAVQPRSAAAKTLYDAGLRLAFPQDGGGSSIFDETFSKIGCYRGDDFTDWHGQTHPLLIVFRNYALEGSSLENIRASYDSSKGNFLGFGVQGSSVTKDGAKLTPRDDLQAWTSQFAKEKISGTPLEAYSRGSGWRMAVILNGSVITAPTVDSVLRESASITGSFTQREISRLESDLKAGSLSFTPRILSEKNVSPELGSQERIHGIAATITALILAIGTMIAYYRFGGVVASVAVILNLLIMWATLQNLGATLTLAGIAGIILTVAMAVDANVLVFERIREEFAATGRIASAVHAGYRKALSAIVDSNITTIIAALILLNFDAGPIRGFAITLIIGIISSLFTALFMTRFFFSWWVLNPHHRELKMANLIRSTHFDFLRFTKPTLLVSAIVILVGTCCFISHQKTILGMDFTGGYALTVDLPISSQNNYRAQVEEALSNQGLSSQQFQIRELHPSNQVRIFLSHSLDQKGGPFYQTNAPINTEGYPYEGNAKITWIVQALQASNIQLSPAVLQDLGEHWTSISGQMSQTMQTSAVIGMSIALLCILAYITLRFEFKYAVSATLCLIHDVVFCLCVLALLNVLGLPLQIDLHTVAALMTIVGYSLNDTIIIFDRIREDVQAMRKRSLSEIINHALNVTLSRTLMTSGITLLVLIPLILLGGSTLFGFALVMAIGVVFGTLSSLFIAAPLMQFFHNREQESLSSES